MKNVDVYIPASAFRFLLNHSTTREVVKGSPKIVIYWKKQHGGLGSTVLTIEDAVTFASQCSFPSEREKEEYLGFFLPSIRSGVALESKKNYRFRIYNWRAD